MPTKSSPLGHKRPTTVYVKVYLLLPKSTNNKQQQNLLDIYIKHDDTLENLLYLADKI